MAAQPPTAALAAAGWTAIARGRPTWAREYTRCPPFKKTPFLCRTLPTVSPAALPTRPTVPSPVTAPSSPSSPTPSTPSADPHARLRCRCLHLRPPLLVLALRHEGRYGLHLLPPPPIHHRRGPHRLLPSPPLPPRRRRCLRLHHLHHPRSREEDAKHLLGCVDLGRAFLAIVWTTYGGIGPPAACDWLDSIFAASYTAEYLSGGTGQDTSHRRLVFYQSLHAALVRGCADMVEHLTPTSANLAAAAAVSAAAATTTAHQPTTPAP